MLKHLALLFLVACAEQPTQLVLCDVKLTCDSEVVPTPLLGACADTPEEGYRKVLEQLSPQTSACDVVEVAARCKFAATGCPQ